MVWRQIFEIPPCRMHGRLTSAWRADSKLVRIKVWPQSIYDDDDDDDDDDDYYYYYSCIITQKI